MASFIYLLIFSISDMKGFLITRAPQEERLLEHVVTGFYACIFVTSLVTNAFLFTVFLRNKHFRDLSTYLIVQMAAADVLYLCVTCSIVAIKNLDIELHESHHLQSSVVRGRSRQVCVFTVFNADQLGTFNGCMFTIPVLYHKKSC